MILALEMYGHLVAHFQNEIFEFGEAKLLYVKVKWHLFFQVLR